MIKVKKIKIFMGLRRNITFTMFVLLLDSTDTVYISRKVLKSFVLYRSGDISAYWPSIS